MAFTIGRSFRAHVVAVESGGNFEFTIFNYKPGSGSSLEAISQVRNDIRIEVSLEIMFRTLRNAGLSLGFRELFTQMFK